MLAHLDWAHEPSAGYPDLIGKDHIGRACHLVGEHLRNHAFRAYGMAATPKELVGAKSIGEIIRREGLRHFKPRDIYNRGRSGLTTSAEVRAALDVLIDADWLRKSATGTAGRPQQSYLVNPKLWGPK